MSLITIICVGLLLGSVTRSEYLTTEGSEYFTVTGSDYSNTEGNAITVPPTPTYLIVEKYVSTSEVDLSWYRSNSKIPFHGYQITWCLGDGTCYKTFYNDVASSRVQYRLGGLTAGAVYDLHVRAYRKYEDEFVFGKSASVQFQVKPNQPDDVTAEVLAPTAALISWTLNSSLENLRVRVSCASRVHDVNATVTSFVCTGLEPWSSHTVNVYVCASLRNGPCSYRTSVILLTPPETFPQPIIYSILSDSPSSFSLLLTVPDSYEEFSGFLLEFCPSNGPCISGYVGWYDQYINTKLQNLPFDTRYDITGTAYIQTGLRKHFSNYAVWYGHHVELQNLPSDTRYDITARAFIETGLRKHFSKPVTAQVRTLKAVPEAPVDLNANALSDQAVYLSWEIYNSTVINYEIFYDDQKIETQGNVTEVVVYRLRPLTTYVFRIRGCGINGCGKEASIAVVTKTGVPDVPRNLKAVRKTPEQIETSWEAPLNWNALDTGYLLRWKCEIISNVVQLEYTSNSYTFFPEDDNCTVSLAAFSVDDGMRRSGDSVSVAVVE